LEDGQLRLDQDAEDESEAFLQVEDFLEDVANAYEVIGGKQVVSYEFS
jgi:hypothetical protein